MVSTIISTEDLEKRLTDPDWVIVDCRFDLSNPDWGFAEYQKSHIPGAVYAHLDRDLSGPAGKETGRHPLPDLELFASRLGSWGIGAGKQVVVYDTNGGAYAARLWWMLRFLGHPAAAVLDGGFPKWQQEGRPVRAGVEQRAPAQFSPQPDWGMVVTADEVEQIRRSPDHRLIDARAPERFRGEVEPIDPVAGHIPGAVNRFHGSNLSPDGALLPAGTLRSQFMDLLGGVPPQNAVVYCGSGVTSCHHLLAMEIAGLPGARLYAGSWSEWITDRTRPTASSR
ncbi:MAG: sulfurtransferase [Chloroflexi bacterium]|nr:sulfurtransferase [Chloroflexota bacterium]